MKLGHMLKAATVLMTSVALLATPTWAAEEAKPVLEIQKAIDMAIGKDDILGQYSRNIEVYKEQTEEMRDISSLAYSTKQLDTREAEQKKTFRKDTIANEVENDYNNMFLLEKRISLLEEQINLGEKQIKQAKIKKDRGYCDALTYEKIVQEVENKKVSKMQLEKNLEDAKKDFLNLTNLDVDKYVLVADETYQPFVLEKSLSAYSSDMANELTKYADQKATLNVDNFWDTIYKSGNGGTGPTYTQYLEGKANVETAKEQVKASYDNYKLLIETKYTALAPQLDTIKNKKDNYNTSVKDMKVAEIKYKSGYLSAIDYETQKVQLDALQVEYLEEVFKYKELKKQVEKPWVMQGK